MLVGAVERLVDGLGDDRLGAALLDLAHEVVAQALAPSSIRMSRPAASSRAVRPGRSCGRRPRPIRSRRRIGVPWPARTPQSSLAVSAWASKWTMPMLPGRRISATAGGGRPGDRVVAAEDDRDGAGLGDLAHLAVDQRVRALDPGGDDVGVAGIDDIEDLERLDVELERVDRARRVLRLADRARPESRTGAVADRVVERRADDRDVRLPGAELGGIGHPRQLHEADRPT